MTIFDLRDSANFISIYGDELSNVGPGDSLAKMYARIAQKQISPSFATVVNKHCDLLL